MCFLLLHHIDIRTGTKLHSLMGKLIDQRQKFNTHTHTHTHTHTQLQAFICARNLNRSMECVVEKSY